jgi:hypothetical protein
MIIRLYKKFVNTKEDSKLEVVKLLKMFYKTETTSSSLVECKKIIDKVYDYTNDPHSSYISSDHTPPLLDYIDIELSHDNKMVYNNNRHKLVSGQTYSHYEFVKIMRELGWEIKTLSEIRQEKLKELGIT